MNSHGNSTTNVTSLFVNPESLPKYMMPPPLNGIIADPNVVLRAHLPNSEASMMEHCSQQPHYSFPITPYVTEFLFSPSCTLMTALWEEALFPISI